MFQWNIQTVMESLEVGTAVKINSSQRFSLIQGGEKKDRNSHRPLTIKCHASFSQPQRGRSFQSFTVKRKEAI